MADLAKIVDDLSKLTVLEAAELSKLLEEKWGVSAAAPVAVTVRIPVRVPMAVGVKATLMVQAPLAGMVVQALA